MERKAFVKNSRDGERQVGHHGSCSSPPPPNPSALQACLNALRFLPNFGHVCVRREHNISSFVLRKSPFYLFLLFRSLWAFFTLLLRVQSSRLNKMWETVKSKTDKWIFFFFQLLTFGLLWHLFCLECLWYNLNNINTNT